MSYLNFNPHLKREAEEVEVARLATVTHKGMAHWAGSGPMGKTCRECAFWQTSGRWQNDEPTPSKCARFFQLMHQWGQTVPHRAYACRHFEQAEQPQPLRRPAPSVYTA